MSKVDMMKIEIKLYPPPVQQLAKATNNESKIGFPVEDFVTLFTFNATSLEYYLNKCLNMIKAVPLNVHN